MQTHPPVPLILIAKCHHKISYDGYDHIRYDRGQSHFWLSDAPIPFGGSHGNPVRKRSISRQSNECPDPDCKIEEADGLAREVVWRLGEGLALGEV